MPASVRPTRKEIEAAEGRTIPDVLGERLDVLFCGINPGLYSAATGHHFARPGNRFWRVLHGAGFTDRVLDPSEDATLPAYGLGLTNLVARATSSASELDAEELRAGARRLVRVAERNVPRMVAVLGVGAFRTAFATAGARIGEQGEPIGGARAWLLPNPSGLNASYRLPDLIRLFAALRERL